MDLDLFDFNLFDFDFDQIDLDLFDFDFNHIDLIKTSNQLLYDLFLYLLKLIFDLIFDISNFKLLFLNIHYLIPFGILNYKKLFPIFNKIPFYKISIFLKDCFICFFIFSKFIFFKMFIFFKVCFVFVQFFAYYFKFFSILMKKQKCRFSAAALTPEPAAALVSKLAVALASEQLSAALASDQLAATASAQKKKYFKIKKEHSEILLKWFYVNIEYPYPNFIQKKELCRITNLTENQIQIWFTNQRQKIKKINNV